MFEIGSRLSSSLSSAPPLLLLSGIMRGLALAIIALCPLSVIADGVKTVACENNPDVSVTYKKACWLYLTF